MVFYKWVKTNRREEEMKNLIAILTIMMVLVGAIFADAESHHIKITVTINETIPSFHLKYNGANSNSTGVAFTGGAERSDNEAVTANINFESNTAADRTVTVGAYIANAAKQTASYRLTFSDGAFKTSGDNPTTVVSPTSITAKVGSGTGYGAANGVSTTVSGAAATVSFGGTVRCTANTLIAEADYLYPKTDIAAGTYTADIIMTVEAL